MKRVYIYGIDNVYGGMERFAYSLISTLSINNKDIKFHILTCFSDFAYKDDFINKYHCEYTVLPNYKKHPIKFYKHLLKTLKGMSSEDVLHLNFMTYRNMLVFKAAKRSKKKTILTCHGASLGKKSVLHALGRKLFKNLGIKTAVSDASGKYAYLTNEYKVIENGIDIKEFSFAKQKREDIRKKLNIDKDTFLIGQVGRVSYLKNQQFILDTVSKLDTSINFKLCFIGNDMEKANLKINDNVLDKIIFTGEVSNVSDYYNALDLFVMPSIGEGFGLAGIEALANGLTCLFSTNVVRFTSLKDKAIYLDLDSGIWVKEINHLYSLKEKSTDRENSLDNKYDINISCKEYLKLY